MPHWNWTWEESTHEKRSPVLLESHEPVTLERAPGPPAANTSSSRPRAGQRTTGGGPNGGRTATPGAMAAGGGGDRAEDGARLRRKYRRRRIGAALALLAVVLLAVVLSVSGTGSRAGGPAPLAGGIDTSKALSAASARGGEPTPQAAEQAINRVLSYTPAVVQGGHKGNEVALTFDDGPGPYTLRLVRALNALHVHATFFPVGEMERYFSEGTRLELSSGDVVGDHTETHPMLAAMSAHEQHEQLLEQMVRMELLGAPRPRLARPPYGSFDAITFRELHALHLLTILWSTDTDDYRMPGVQAIVHSALSGAHPGAIILMHDGGGDRSQTIAALPAIVNGLRNRHLRPVTVPQLLVDDPPAPGQPIPTSLAGD
jgi:peptidoglycan/xylan/chitin deacetylase (PgdA/CDA1 family)